MSLKIINQYIQDGVQIIEYSRDGETVSHTVKELVQTAPTPPELQITLEDKINYIYYKEKGLIL